MSRYLEVMTLLRRQMNGAVSGAMSDRGIDYSMNYGVSLPTIKDIAKKFVNDHDLATDLYRQQVREMRLAAIYIEDASRVNLVQADAWSAVWESVEIAQVCAMELLWRSPKAYEIAAKWFEVDAAKLDITKANSAVADSVRGLRHLAACHIIGKIADSRKADEFRRFVTVSNNAFGLRELYRAHEDLRENIKAISNEVFDLSWQLEEI